MKLKSYQLPYLLVFLGVFSVFISSSKTLLIATENIMDIDEIVPGMKGYGKTVFLGDRVEMFNVEVLGILRNWEAKSNMILIRMSGDPLEKSGIIAGMSGSPVYIDNRLIGAVAYGWSFAKEAIAGVTPINEMKSTLLDIPVQEKDISLTSADWELPSFPQNEPAPGSPVAPLMSQVLIQGSSGNMKLTPILAPLVVSGVNGEVLQKMQPLFNTYGLYPVQGGSYVSVSPLSGKGDSISEKDKLVPGASVAAILVKGTSAPLLLVR